VVLAQRIAAGERESVRRRNPDVSIDVDTICAVAMELDPTRRYASAAALASDLVNVLERRPIAARRTGPWIRAQRWTERNPAGAAALALGALVLIGGPLGYGVLEAGAAEKERGLNTELRSANQTVALTNKNLETAKGEVEKKNSDLASSLQREKEQTARAERNLKTALEAIEKMLVTVGAEDLREIPRFGPVRIELLERARKFYLGLAQQDPESVDVQRELARITRSLGDVYEDLGRSPEALAEYTKAVELSSAVIAIDPDSINTRHMYASNLMQLALMRHQTGDMEQARSAYLEVLPIVEKLCLEDPKNTRFSHDLASSLLNLGGIEMAAGSADEALMHRGRAVEVMRQALAKEPGNAELVSHLTKCLNGLSNCEQGPGASERSRADLLEAWNLISGHLAGHPDARDIRFDLIEVSVNYGLSLVTSDAEGAERVLSKGFETGKRLVLDFPEDFTARNALVAVATNLGYHLTNQSRWAEALEPLNDAVEHGEALVSHESERVDSRCSLATALGCRSTALVGLHRIDEARADATRGVEIFDKVRQSLPSHPMVVAGSASCIMQRAEVERASGDWHKALESTDAAIELGASRSDISFQAFETYWHIAQAARVDPALAGEERTRTLSVLESQALDQLESTIEQGFEDLKRLETHADYAGLRSEPRFQSLVSELASRSK
jgi:tetratricopeptide (TPR) repeat protein